VPVWEEQQLGNYSRGYPPHMPFQAPVRAAAHSALYLCVDAGGDQLVGRADNGAATDATPKPKPLLQPPMVPQLYL
jgi:hypothetical protein